MYTQLSENNAQITCIDGLTQALAKLPENERLGFVSQGEMMALIEDVFDLSDVLDELPKSARLNFILQGGFLALFKPHHPRIILSQLPESDLLTFALQEKILSFMDVYLVKAILSRLPNKCHHFLSAITGVEWPIIAVEDILVFSWNWNDRFPHNECRKENLFGLIKMMPCMQDQMKVLEQCLDPKTPIGMLCWEQRGSTACDLKSGVLKEMNEYLQSLKSQRVAAISIFNKSLDTSIKACNPVVDGRLFKL